MERLAVVLGFQPSEINALELSDVEFWDDVAKRRLSQVGG